MRAFLTLCLLALLLGCTKESEYPAFDYNSNAGIWVLEELVFEDGNIIKVSEDNFDHPAHLFGYFVACIRLNRDKTYNAVSWTNKTNYTVTNEMGTYRYDSSKGTLRFEIESDPVRVYTYKLKEISATNMQLIGELNTIIKLKKHL